MEHNNPSQNNVLDFHGSNFTRFNNYSSNFHPSTAIQEIQEDNPSSYMNYDYTLSHNNFPTISYHDRTGSNASNQFHIPQYDKDQNPPPSANNNTIFSFNSPNPPQSSNPEVYRFYIPGFKIIIVPDFPIETNVKPWTNNPQTQFQQQNSLGSFYNF